MAIEAWRMSVNKKFEAWRKKAEETAEPSIQVIRTARVIQQVLDSDIAAGDIRPLEIRLAQAVLDTLDH